MYRHHPQTTLARKLVAKGAIGRLAFVRAALNVSVPPGDIRRNADLGGGALLDLGCYCVSGTRLFAGEPERVYAQRLPDGPGGVDLRFAATMTLADGVLAQFDAGLDLPRRDELELIGTDGRLTVPDPWICRSGYLKLERAGRTEWLPADPTGAAGLTGEELDPYRIEFDTVAAAIASGAAQPFGRADAVAQARVPRELRRSSEQDAPVEIERVGMP